MFENKKLLDLDRKLEKSYEKIKSTQFLSI
jgi:hypothetical protein